MKIHALTQERRSQAVTVLSAAFRDYPVMRYVIGEHPAYENQLGSLIRFYIDLRYECGWPVLAAEDEDGVKAVALVNTPTSEAWISGDSPALATLREALHQDAYARLVAFEESSAGVEPSYPHYFLGMVGVLPAEQGKGYAHRLIKHIIAVSERDAASRALALTTEDAANHSYYVRQGFTMTSSVKVGALTSSCFIRAT